MKQALYKHKINGPEPIINTETSSPGTLLCPLKATAFVFPAHLYWLRQRLKN